MPYIDREKAQMFLRIDCLKRYPASFANGLLVAADQLNKIPTVDVVEVKHEEWRCAGMSRFTIIDNETGTYPDCEKIALSEEWAKHLIYCDIDTFAITEDGGLILLDDCGNCAFCPVDRFKVIFDKE